MPQSTVRGDSRRAVQKLFQPCSHRLNEADDELTDLCGDLIWPIT